MNLSIRKTIKLIYDESKYSCARLLFAISSRSLIGFLIIFKSNLLVSYA